MDEVAGPTPSAPEELVITDSGAEIFVRIWRPAGEARAVLAICHGLNSHSGQYAWVGEQMAAAGIATYALDLRGRGRSGGERFYVETVDEYVADLAALVDLARSRERGLPVFVLGHSMGGVIACLYVLEHQEELAGFICESFAYKLPLPGIGISVLKGVSHIVPHAHVFALKMADFTRDPEVLAQLEADPLTLGESQPSQTAAAIARADEVLGRSFDRFTLPLLILHGTADKATLPAGSEQFFAEASSADKQIKLYEGHYHDLLADLGRAEVLADMRGWIEVRLPPAGVVAA